MKAEIEKMLENYINKQRESYNATNNYNRCYHRCQGYVACLIDMGVIDIDERAKVLDYMVDKFENNVE